MRPYFSRSVRKRNFHYGSYGVLAVSATALLCGFAAPAHAQFILNAIFNGSAPPGISGWTPVASDATNGSAIESTINLAVKTYETTFTNPITVNIAYYEMPGGLGENEANIQLESYSSVYSALVNNANTANALTAVANLPNQTNNPVNGNPQMWVTTANARALGFTTSGVTIDAWVGVNTSICNLSPTGTQNPSDYSLLSVVEHETDEALGLGSGLNLVGDTGFGGSGPGGVYTTSDPIRTQDLFRYSADNVRSYTTGSSATSYFSIDGGATNLVNFNQQGGGSDYGDWASESPPKVQDAFGTQGANISLTTDGGVELEALNVQGYQMGTPEPGSLALLGAGATISGYGWLRRRRVRKSVA